MCIKHTKENMVEVGMISSHMWDHRIGGVS